MKIDLARFHATFFEESVEGLDVMERGLLQLDAQGEASADSPEAVNAIFRAAHSIKGGAATFGFSAVADFTHHVETLLDQMRSGARPLTGQAVDLLLRSVDALRGLLIAARDGSAADFTLAATVQKELEALLSGQGREAQAEPPRTAEANTGGFRIHFVPRPELFLSGNDPLLILRELATLGDLQVELDTAALPPLVEANPESCYLAWTLSLHTGHSRAEVAELFSWVEDECELSIEPLESAAVASAAPAERTDSAPAIKSAEAAPRPAILKTVQKQIEHGGDTGSIRVSTVKIDALINLVGELVITRAMLAQHADALDPVLNEKLLLSLQQLDRNTRQLQEAVLSTRMLPIEAVFNRFPRMLRDLAARLGKQVRLDLVGEATELDKSVIEKITDPLTHLVRNSVDHGIEEAQQRIDAGKPAEGVIRLSATHQGGHICIEVADDGAGLDRAAILAKARAKGMTAGDDMSDAEVWQLIFAPGFSTKAEVSEISGRGVGMDVVRRNILSLGGQIEITSERGQGMRVGIRLPLTLAILDGMSVAVGSETFIVPLNCVIESLQPTRAQLRSIGGQGRLLLVRDEYLPLVYLHELFRIDGAVPDPLQGIAVVLEAEGRKIALLVDQLLGQQQVVIKSLETNYRRVFGVSGATIHGDGRVALILDAAGLVRSTLRAAAA